MKVLVVGSGGREHVLVKKVAPTMHQKKEECAKGVSGYGYSL